MNNGEIFGSVTLKSQPKQKGSAAPACSLRKEISYRVHYLINAYPLLYMPLARFRHRFSQDRVVRNDTDFVIEAFGRTGTTFANFAFLSAQRRRVRTVHHTHAAAQVIVAVRRELPTLVIVREPEEVALSHMVRHQVSGRAALVAWIRFHERLVPYRDKIVFCRFEEMTQNFTPVIERVNEKFGTNFDLWQHTKENEAEIFEFIKTRNRDRFRKDQEEQRKRAFALPTQEREALKQRLRSELEAASLVELRLRAGALYKSLTEV